MSILDNDKLQDTADKLKGGLKDTKEDAKKYYTKNIRPHVKKHVQPHTKKPVKKLVKAVGKIEDAVHDKLGEAREHNGLVPVSVLNDISAEDFVKHAGLNPVATLMRGLRRPELVEAGVGAVAGGAAGYGAGSAMDEVDRPTSTLVGAVLGAGGGLNIGKRLRHHDLPYQSMRHVEELERHADGQGDHARRLMGDASHEVPNPSADAWRHMSNEAERDIRHMRDTETPRFESWEGPFGLGKSKQLAADKSRFMAKQQENFNARSLDPQGWDPQPPPTPMTKEPPVLPRGFEATSEWQPVPEGATMRAGLEYRMDMSGDSPRTMVRDPGSTKMGSFGASAARLLRNPAVAEGAVGAGVGGLAGAGIGSQTDAGAAQGALAGAGVGALAGMGLGRGLRHHGVDAAHQAARQGLLDDTVPAAQRSVRKATAHDRMLTDRTDSVRRARKGGEGGDELRALQARARETRSGAGIAGGEAEGILGARQNLISGNPERVVDSWSNPFGLDRAADMAAIERGTANNFYRDMAERGRQAHSRRTTGWF